MNQKHFDVIVIGAGPGGSTLATLLAKNNHSVALIEKDNYPIFKIGESLLPHSMDILKKSGVFPKIDSGKYIRKYGASFIDHRETEPVYFEFVNGLDNDHAYAFEVPREEFDKDLLEHAKESGVRVFQPCLVKEVDLQSEWVQVETSEGPLSAKYLVDASGRSAFLGRQFRSRNKNDHFINNVAVFNHYRNVSREIQVQEGDIIIGILPNNSWSWHIPFKGDITSVGAVVSPQVYKEYSHHNDIVRELLKCHPRFVNIMAHAEPLREQQVASNYSYASEKKIGEHWIMVGDAATFLDPVFSSGVHISLQSADLAADVIHQALQSGAPLTQTEKGQNYEQRMKLGVDRFQSLLLLFYQSPFYQQMSKTKKSELVFKAFTSAISGDMWNDDNPLFRFGVLKDGKLPREDHAL